MAKRKRYKRADPGPNPDPERYILVHTKEGSYWRLKRGLNKPALLNATLQQNVDSLKVCGPAAKRMAMMLKEDLHGLDMGRLIARFGGLLRKALNEKGIVDFSFFGDYDFQPDHSLDALLQVPFQCRKKGRSVELVIPIQNGGVKRHNRLVSKYYFDLVLLHGDPTKENGLRVDSHTSVNYCYEPDENDTCTLSVDLPEREGPWMAMLKVSSLEGNELAHHPRHYGMKVVAIGG
jgi:hypothetical protein